MAVTGATKQWSGQYITFTAAGAATGNYAIDTTNAAGDSTAASLLNYDYYVLVSKTGTLTVEYSPDEGTNWYPIALTPLSTVATTPLLTTVAAEAVGFSGCYKDLRVTASGGAATLIEMTGKQLYG